MRAWAWVLAFVVASSCASRWSQASSPIRISAYGYPDAQGYGRKLSPKIAITRPRRNATFVVSSSEIRIQENEEKTRDVSPPKALRSEEPHKGNKSNSDEIMEQPRSSTRIRVPLNRMGVASVSSRRRTRPRIQRPKLRSDMESTTLRNAPQPPSIQPPSIPTQGLFGPPSIPGAEVIIKPPAPPVLPPSTPKPTLGVNTFGPPSIPQPVSSPAPPPGADETQVTDIKCMDTGSTSSFMAVLSLPLGFNAIPVFEDRPAVDPTTNTACRMIPTQLTNDMFQLIVSDLDRCGVQTCRQPNGEKWLCLRLRFPLVNGLKLPEDEIIQIKCRPQDKMAQDTHVLRVATAKYAAKEAINGATSPSLFEGGQQEFQCEIGLFRKLPGTDLFASIVTPEVELNLGEEVQLRSIVRAGDGWQYSRITTIIIQKVGAPRTRSILNAADLVFADGCRNPSYKVIARQHPKRDPRNPLINNFTFRMFMFQDMEVGDTLMITANVIGCIDAEDCAPVNCASAGDDDILGFGRRKRHAVDQFSFTTIVPAAPNGLSSGPPYPPPITTSSSSFISSTTPSVSSSQSHRRRENVTNWERNLSVRVKIPDKLIMLYTNSTDAEVHQESVEAQECRLYLFITLGVAAVFCMSSIVFVVFTLVRGRRKDIPSPNPVAHVSGQSGLMMPVSPVSTCSSLLSSEEDSAASTCSSPLGDFPVPPTVRQRKHQVNAELLSVFDNEHKFPYATYYPGMFNYYGYMVVPRKTKDSSNEKRSLRAVKRDHKKHRRDQPECVCCCTSNPNGKYDHSVTEKHTAVIRISASRSDNDSSASKLTPKPLPRTKKDSDENIYSEITLSSTPTMV
ncbi:uncharacterized protein [Panulirus ornatus]|uniref:uncharacterized protein isoform X2 n=1 Tax=Panulirus ornatus TaxID=150431 RepID=UPI003A8494A3